MKKGLKNNKKYKVFKGDVIEGIGYNFWSKDFEEILAKYYKKADEVGGKRNMELYYPINKN